MATSEEHGSARARAAHGMHDEDVAFERAKKPLVVAMVTIAVGLAIAGSLERTAGGAIVLAGWVVGIAALHRLGRAGSVRRDDAPPPSSPPPPSPPSSRSDLGAKDDDPDAVA